MVVESLHLLCSKRLSWPPGVLQPSDLAVLKKTADGSLGPTRKSPPVVALNLLVTRLLVRRLMLQPREVIPGLRPSGQSIHNMQACAAPLPHPTPHSRPHTRSHLPPRTSQWFSAAFHVITKLALLHAEGKVHLSERESGRPFAVKDLEAALELDAAQMRTTDGKEGFTDEVGKVIRYGLTVPAFESFLREAALALGGWVTSLLEAGANLVHEHAVATNAKAPAA